MPAEDASTPASAEPDIEGLLAEQRAYYRAVSGEYERHALPGWHGLELERALESFGPSGDVLELACGTGIWTERLLRGASTLTAVDAAPEMLAIARARVGDARVRFVQADLFRWRPERAYDVVFFAFWLSHVPPARFEGFWELVADCLRPGGRVFFVDDGHRTAAELLGGESGVIVRRQLSDGSKHRLVKVVLEPAELGRRLRALGWRAAVWPAAGPFFWGEASRA